ncbi:C-C chemokine receptor type 6-like [Conger conger]|uniref:C-C chemokine receptor type 6-like n=1 Tax=Conger conger TaxID=82655 RepID=UPI002A5A5D0B|nr:C-C chemokine receptor type 6-like [Conger conger]XP_061099154.1 C-C chemokine receptor type 6-like [Conger conger]
MDYYVGLRNHSDNLEDYTYDDIEELCETVNNHRLEQVVRPYVHSAICIAGLLGNILVIITYAFYKRAKSMTDMYLLNVAFSDVLFVVTLPLIIYNEEYNWSMGTWACKLLRSIYSVNLYSGMLLLACISADRYIAIVQARKSLRIRSQALVYSRVICIAVWVLALGLSIPTFVYYETYGYKYQYIDFNFNLNKTSADEDTLDGQKVCYFRFEGNGNAQLMKVLVPSMQVAVGFFVPLLVMGFCYSSIVTTLLPARNRQRHKAVRIIMAVVVVFIACHLPYNISLLYYTVALFKQRECGEEDTLAMVLTITETLAYLHSCLNPVLYAFLGVKFRNHFCKILEDLWCMIKRYMCSRCSSRSESWFSRRSTEGPINRNMSSFTM